MLALTTGRNSVRRMADTMTTVVVAALSGGSVGAVASLLAPWASWGVEKRRDVRAHHRALIASWRSGLAEWEQRSLSGHDVEDPIPFLSLPWYQTLRPRMDQKARTTAADAAWQQPKSDTELSAAGSALAEEIDRIEREWGLK